MFMKIANNILSVEASSLGGELSSVKLFNQELLYQKEGSWKHQDHIAFPLIGTGKEYSIHDVPLCMTIHGFAHELDFLSDQISSTEMSFTLKDNADTRKVFPYPFLLKETIKVEDDVLIRRYEVSNTGEEDMPFSIGDHAGFKAIYGQASLVIPEDLTEVYDCPKANVLHSRSPFPGKEETIFDKKLFATQGTLVFDNPKNPLRLNNGRGVTIEYRFSSPYIAIWSPGKEDDHFICVEAWWGLPQRDDDPLELAKRPDFTLLKPNETKTFESRYRFILG